MTALPPMDPRAWLVWGAAATLPLLAGRHPLVLAEILVIALIVRALCLDPAAGRGWSWLLRLATLAIPIGMLFNVFTVHAGDAVIVTLPGRLPVIGGDLTWNALAYGALSGLTVVALVAIGTTVAGAIAWSAGMRLLPAHAGSLAVAGSVAWSFLPQLARSWREIRETQAARGHRWRGPRDIVPLVTPLLAGGLDRAIVTAEALEARGFGARAPHASARPGRTLATIGTLTVAVVAIYLLAAGSVPLALALLAGCAAIGTLLVIDAHRTVPRTTRYRPPVWTRRDTLVVAGALLAVVAVATTLQVAPDALRWDPYPTLQLPRAEALVSILLAGLVAPALLAPASPREAV